MPDVVPLKVTIRRDNKRMVYPGFNNLDAIKADANNKSDIHYDRIADIKTDAPHSPAGVMYGIKFVNTIVAIEALAKLGPDVEQLTDAQAQVFWETYVQGKAAKEREDTNVLQALSARRQLMVALGQSTVALDARITKALDPTDNEPGVTQNRNKSYADFKADHGYNIVQV